MSRPEIGGALCVAISEYLVGADVVLENLVEHRAWLKSAYDHGVMLFSGRQNPPTGGVLGFLAGSQRDAEEFVAGDPFAVNNVACYRVIAVSATTFPWRSPYFEAFSTARAAQGSLGHSVA